VGVILLIQGGDPGTLVGYLGFRNSQTEGSVEFLLRGGIALKMPNRESIVKYAKYTDLMVFSYQFYPMKS
jgi:hypothetical protein